MSGVGYYSLHLLEHLVKEAGDCEFFVISNRVADFAGRCPPGVTVWRRHQFPIRSLWMQLFAPWALRGVAPEVAHFTNSVAPIRTSTRVIVTIHDMTLRLLPHLHPWQRRLTVPLMERSARRAQAVVAVSQSAKRDIVRLMNIPDDRVRVIYEAPAPVFHKVRSRQLLDEVRRSYDLPPRFLLTVGTIEPRKNLVRTLRVFCRLKKRGLKSKLVFAGEFGWGYRVVSEEIRRLGLESEVLLPGYVPFEWLPALYSLSEALLFPSLYEGFGLPVVEAMACGVPVITSRGSAMEEIAGDAALLVDPHSEESLERAIWALCMDRERSTDLSRRGLERVCRFSWTKTAREVLELYREIA